MPDHDCESLPETEPHPAPIFDTGPHPQALVADPEPTSAAEAPPSGPLPAPVQSVTVPGQYHYLKWWKLVLVIAGVWIPAEGIGLGLYNYWVHDPTPHKTLPVFIVLVYVVVCTVGGLMLAMVQHKPLVAALAIAVMSAPFASVIAAAPVYGVYYCDHATQVNPATRCLVGMIPY